MGWDDPYGDSEISNLPQEAANPFSEVFDPQDFWLERADEGDQLVAMRGWFLARYCDPTLGTPYNGREGGYLFIHGGPFHPEVELMRRFSGIVDGETIQKVVDEMIDDVGEQWAPIHDFPEDEYDERYDLGVQTRHSPLENLRSNLRQAQDVLELQGAPLARDLALKLVFGAAVGAFEAFLWETVDYWVENDDQAVRGIVTNIQVFRQESIPLSEIFEKFEGIRARVKAHLQNIVWHRWEQVAPLFQKGLALGDKMPGFKQFDAALLKRHDIVHRMGRDRDGNEVSVTAADIDGLVESIEKFAFQIDLALSDRVAKPWTPPGAPF